ncbi:hypothetical protein BASA83_009299 [Batrachochytrium salamandrivorans]|nr:hypothetical protein BASA81_016897 [Batrachochytrium salamandrivorans]KAH9268457.1 hypothetical protein BASA83_009299 [Batrachochytrium salamandrivorans]
MKFNALVVAAMVITSVNAVGRGGSRSLFEGNGRMTKSGSKANLLDKDLESVVTQNSPEDEPRQGSSPDSPKHELTQTQLDKFVKTECVEGLTEDPTRHKAASVLVQESQRHKPRPRPSWKSLARKLKPVLPSKSPDDKPDTPQVFKPIEKDPICDPIVAELSISWRKISDFDRAFSKQEPEFYKLLRNRYKKPEENGEKDNEEKRKEEEEEKKINADALRSKEIQEWIDSNPKSIPRLQEIKAEYIRLEQEHRVIWARLKDNDCPTKEFKRLSPDHMKKEGYFPKWDFEFDLMSFDEQ